MNGAMRRRCRAPIARTIGVAIILALLELGCAGVARTARTTAPQPGVSDAATAVPNLFDVQREIQLRAAPERNLREQGYEWDEVIVFPPNVRFASAVDFKAPERKKISDRGYTILVNIGDQDSDLAGGYAERTFKLPNPVYLIP